MEYEDKKICDNCGFTMWVDEKFPDMGEDEERIYCTQHDEIVGKDMKACDLGCFN